MPDLFNKDIFYSVLLELWRRSGLSKMAFYDKIGIRNAFSVYAPAKPGQRQRKVKAPSLETLLKISAEFHVSVNYLLTGNPDGGYSERQACIDLPEEDIRPLVAAERDLLKKALAVLRSPGLDNEPDVTLLNTINALHSLVRQQRSAIDGPDGRGGAGRAAGKRGSAREKAAAAAGGARK